MARPLFFYAMLNRERPITNLATRSREPFATELIESMTRRGVHLLFANTNEAKPAMNRTTIRSHNSGKWFARPRGLKETAVDALWDLQNDHTINAIGIPRSTLPNPTNAPLK